MLFAVCTLALAKGQSLAPEVWATAGDTYQSANGTVAWTMGETVIETAYRVDEMVTVTQGFHQPEVYKETGIVTQPQENSPVFSVYPNPTSGIIRIKLSKPYNQPVRVSLFNTLGQLIQSELWLANSASEELELSLEQLANGVYFLEITTASTSLGVYKVQKDRN